MKYILISFLVLLYSLSAWAKSHQLNQLPKGELTLEQAISITLEKNPGMAEAEQRISQARAVLTQARSAWLPRINVKASAMDINGTIQPDWRPDLRITENFKEYKSSAQASFLLFDGFARYRKIAAASRGLAKSEFMKENTKRLLIRAVSLTYYKARISMEKMKIAQQDQEFNEILQEQAQIRYEAGVAPESEMLNFSVRALTAKTNFLDAQKELATTCLALAQLMGINESELSSAYIPSQENLSVELNLPDPEAEIAFAMENRPDIKAIDSGIAALNKKYQAAKSNIFPKIALVSGVEYTYQDNKGRINVEEEHNNYAGAAVQWELFTGGQRKGEIAEAYAKLQEVKEQRKNLVLSVHSDIKKAVVSAQTAWDNWQNRKRIADMANTIRDHVQKAYKAGKASLTRLNQAQSDCIKARSGASTGQLAYLAALAELEAASGRNTRLAKE